MIWCFLLVVGAAARQFDMTDDLFGSHDLENSDFLEHIFFGEFFNANHTEELLLDLGPLCGDTIDCDYAFVKSWTLFVQFKPSGLTTFIPLNHRAFFHSKIAGNGERSGVCIFVFQKVKKIQVLLMRHRRHHH